MKLSEIKLFEEPIPIRTAEELWSENGVDAAQYITMTVYFVRPTPDKKDMFDVLYDEGGKRKRYSSMNSEDLNAAFAPIRPNQKPDVEGFTQYRSADVFDAFKYDGDPVKVSLNDISPEENGETFKLEKGDYMLRHDTDDEFVYTIEKANFFDNGYIKK